MPRDGLKLSFDTLTEAELALVMSSLDALDESLPTDRQMAAEGHDKLLLTGVHAVCRQLRSYCRDVPEYVLVGGEVGVIFEALLADQGVRAAADFMSSWAGR